MFQKGLDAVSGVGVGAAAKFSGAKENGYTTGMDSVRFGRVLGIGTRLAAKTLASAMDAAMAPNPAAGTGTAGVTSKEAGAEIRTEGGTQGEGRGAPPASRMGQEAAQKNVRRQQTGQGLKRGGKRFGEAVWGPFVKLSGVLWLEFTGVFFGLFAVTAGMGLWKQRAAWRVTATNHDAHVRLLLVAGMAVVFGYFFVSSFVRANRRGKRG